MFEGAEKNSFTKIEKKLKKMLTIWNLCNIIIYALRAGQET